MSSYYLIILGSAVFILVVLGIFEFWRHHNNLKKIPIRIHVNGTRGKSSVTRLIAAGLRAGGINTCAKTTGTLPRMILSDGREYPVFRPGRTNVIEQLRIVAAAADAGAKAIVVECMALQPYLQWLSEFRMMRATHGVVTNARPDHLDVMGPTVTDVALALGGMIPKNAKVYSGERSPALADIFKKICADRKSEYNQITEEDVTAITDADVAKFAYIEHKENVALALKICNSLGVNKDVALAGMVAATPDPGVMMDYRVQFYGRNLVFINGFAANDPESTKTVWQIATEKFKELPNKIALFNCRADRPERSLQLGSECAAWLDKQTEVVLMGTGTYLFAKAALSHGLDNRRLHFMDDMSITDIFENLVGMCGKSALIVGMGNIGDQGLDMVQYFKNRSLVESLT